MKATEKTVGDIIKGSQRARKMNEDIRSIICIIWELINDLECSFESKLRRKQFSIGDYTWQVVIGADIHIDSRLRPIIYCHKAGDESRDAIVFDFGHGDTIKLKFISGVHATLPVFLEKMVELFPEIEASLQPLLLIRKAG